VVPLASAAGNGVGVVTAGADDPDPAEDGAALLAGVLDVAGS
jgi:hypothetical protein